MTPESLLHDLASTDGDRRRAAIAELRDLLPDALPDVLARMHHPDWQVRSAAAAVLDHADQDDDVELALLAAANDVDGRVRWSAYHALACTHCKPDGCISSGVVALLADRMVHDPSVRVRRKVAGELMWGQHGRDEVVTAAFRQLLADEVDPTLRERAAKFLASSELPRTSLPAREWNEAWQRRVAELV